MKNNKILIRINNLDEINDYQKESINNFLFALDGFSIGYPSFSLNELEKLDCNVYLLLNRVLNNDDIDALEKTKSKLSFVKGIFFEDVGVYHLFKDEGINLIWNQAHFVINSSSINIWLKNVYSACLSNELTIDEIGNLLSKVVKPVVLPILGHNNVMYSRRLLLTNFNHYKSLKGLNEAIIKPTEDISFKVYENSYGTIFFNSKYFNLYNYLDKIFDNKILFYYLDSSLSSKELLEYINKGTINNEDNRFLLNKTVYRVEDLK
jgi:hypothetical protein